LRLIQELRPGTRICIVGEAPGAQEDKTGRPFAGATGDLTFDQLLPNAAREAGIRVERSDCSITNVVHVRPPGNDFTKLLRPKPSAHFVLGVIQLKADLELLRPNIVIAFGAQALRALTKKGSMDKWRGSILSSTLVPAMKIIGTWHPAYTFKGEQAYPYRYVIERDLAKALRESLTPALNLPRREFIIDPPTDERDRVVTELLKAEWLTVDIESYLVCLKCGTPRPPKSKRCNACGDIRVWHIPRCICFADCPQRVLVLPFGPTNDATIALLLRSQQPKNFQNGWAFDLPVLARAGFEVVNYEWDTMIGFHSIYPECASSDEETAAISGKKRPQQPALRKGLAFLTPWYTNEQFYKDDGKTWAQDGDITQLYKYNGKDGCVQDEVKRGEEIDLRELNNFHVLRHSMSLTPSCMTMSQRGFRVDLDERRRLTTAREGEIKRLQALLDSIAGREINVKSPDVRWLLFEHLKMPVRKRSSKTDTPTADKYVIADLALRNPHPALMTIIEIRERRDELERYLSAPIGLDGRWRCSWDITGARTWRLASRAYIDGTGGNLQNQPPGLRSMFVADPGMALISVDLSQAEARVVAWEADCTALIELFNDPTRDVHAENASRFYSLPIIEVTYERRYAAKRTIHASNYGMGPPRFVEVVNADAKETGIRITLQEARLCQEAYFMLYPEIKNVYWMECRESIRKDRTITNCYNFTRLFLGQWSEKFLHEVYAQKPQSTVGILNCRSQTRVFDTLDITGQAQLLVNGHDSLVVQAPLERVPEVAAKMQECMTERLQIKDHELVIPTDVEVGLNWGKRSKSKNGTVANPNGLRPLDEWVKEIA
jgi:uracil-DNA glycosylase family 4